MSTLKEKFDNFEPKPDDSLWQSINDTLKLRAIRRRNIFVSSAAAIVVTAAIAIALFNKNDNKIVSSDNNVVVLSQNGIESPSHEAVMTQAKDDNFVSQGVTSPNETKAIVQNELQPQQSGDQPAGDALIDKGDNKVAVATQSNAPVSIIAPSPVVTESNPSQPTVADKVSAVKPSEQNPKLSVVSDSIPGKNNNVKPAKAASSELNVWVPNAFAPDDPNDAVRKFTVKPTNASAILSYEIYIYSRGGKLVYHSRDINESWDGTFKGHAQPMGSYVYIIQMNVSQKGVQHQKGTVTLIR
ncbi:MAG: gliding motility-associated C-terminal domain-containing protein [Bacteroidales bacterium]|nr:gliding motility-associated C-terminal domain-containing protein [Bacteroidales bacterium]